MDTAVSILKQLSRRVISYQPAFKNITKSTVGAILLSQLCWRAQVSTEEEFCATDAQLIEETHLGTKELLNAKKACSRFVRITRRGVPAKSYYLVDFKAIVNALSSYAETAELDPPKGQNCTRRNGITTIEDLRSRSKIKKDKNIDRTECDPRASLQNKKNHDAEFEELWTLHRSKCKKGSKPKALSALKAQLKKYKNLTVSDLCLKLRLQFDERDFKVRANAWVADVPHLSSWLNGERYNDIVESEQEILQAQQRTKTQAQQPKSFGPKHVPTPIPTTKPSESKPAVAPSAEQKALLQSAIQSVAIRAVPPSRRVARVSKEEMAMAARELEARVSVQQCGMELMTT
jgi:hypothetical protein